MNDNIKEADTLKAAPKWASGALKRGFYSAVQAYHATNLSIIMLAPKFSEAVGFQKIFGDDQTLRNKISDWEHKIKLNDYEPAKPSYLKSGLSFVFFNAAYLTPIIALGVAAGLAGGPYAALITAGLVNTHATMGESFVRTARKRSTGIEKKDHMDSLMDDEDFRKTAKINVSIMGGVCLGITLAAGPLARLLGGFTSGAFSSLSRTPLGGILTEKLVDAAHHNVVKSLRKPLGHLFSNAVHHGPEVIAAKTTAFIALTRATTSSIMSRVMDLNKRREPAIEQDNDPDVDARITELHSVLEETAEELAEQSPMKSLEL